MATIKVKGQREPIIVSDTKAQQVKKAWIDSKDRHMKVDLGHWSGELSQITAINTEPEPTYKQDIDYSAYYMPISEWLKKSLDSKVAYGLEWFRFVYAGKAFKLKVTIGEEAPKPSEEIIGRATRILRDYYTENPADPICPSEHFAFLLPGYVEPREVVSDRVEV